MVTLRLPLTLCDALKVDALQGFFLFFTCIGKEKYYYTCTLLIYIEKKGSFYALQGATA
jgi:hypothetical protein